MNYCHLIFFCFIIISTLMINNVFAEDNTTFSCESEILLDSSFDDLKSQVVNNTSLDKANPKLKATFTSETLFISAPRDATGKISLYFDNNKYSEFRIEKSSEVDLLKLKTGLHSYKINYAGNSKYSSQTLTGKFNKTYDIFVSSDDSYKYLETVELYVVCPEDINKDIILTLEGKNYTQKLTDGSTRFKLKNLPGGEYKVYITYPGDNKYYFKRVSYEFSIYYQFKIEKSDFNNSTISLNIPKNAMGNITFKLSNQTKSSKQKNGVVNVTFDDVKMGIYYVTASYDGNDYLIPDMSQEIIVNPVIDVSGGYYYDDCYNIDIKANSYINDNIEVYHGLYYMDPTELDLDYYEWHKISNLKLINGSGNLKYANPITGCQYIMIKYKNQTLGITQFLLNPHIYLPKEIINGESYITVDVGKKIVFNEFSIYNNQKKIMDEVRVSGVKKFLLNNLSFGKQTIELCFDDYSITTGIFFEYINVTVLKPNITAKNLKTLYLKGAKYTVKIKIKNKIVKNKIVKFKIAGKTKIVKTNSKGLASIKITQVPKNYTISVSYAGLTVKKKVIVESLIKAKNLKVHYGKSFKIKIALKKVNNKYLKNKKITLKLKGKKYISKTNKKGIAIFKIYKFKSSKSIYQVSYLKDSVKRTITVK